MAENFDTTIKIGVKSDLAGAVQTEKQFEKLKQNAREFGKESGKASTDASAAIGKVTSTVGKLRSVLTGLGVAGAFAGLISSIKSITESFREADKEAEKFSKTKNAAAQAKEVSDIADAYAKLAKAIQDSAAANDHQNAMIAKAVAAERELEDASAKAAEQRELAAIDPNDPTAKEQRAAISAKYARLAGNRAAARGKEDIVYRRQELNSQADQLAKGAAADRESAEADGQMIAAIKAKMNDALTRATTENGEDATGFWSAFGNNITNIATGKWGRVGDSRTEAGNALRAEAQAEADKYQIQIDQLQKSRDQKLQRAKDADTSAARKREEAEIEGRRLEAAGINISTTDAAGTASRDAAERTLSIRQSNIESDAIQRSTDIATIKSAPGKIATIKGKIAGYQGRIDSAEQKVVQEQLELKAASDRLSTFNANVGTRRTGVSSERSELEEEIKREENDVHAAQTAAAGIRSTLGAAIKDLLEEMRRIESEVKSAKSRTKFNESEK